MKPLLWSFCDASGTWSEPWRQAGYRVRRFDLKRGQDVRLLERADEGPEVLLAAPPCTHLAGSGARWWASKGKDALLEALAVVDACLRAVVLYQPRVWALENPVGRLATYLGKPVYYFDPHQYAGWADVPAEEAYTKRTGLWGRFNIPEVRPVPPALGSYMWTKYGGRSDRTKTMRSITPTGFARAFCAANLRATQYVRPIRESA